MTTETFKWGLIALAYISLFTMGLLDNSRGPSYPMILETFNITTSKGSLIFTLSSLAGLTVNLTSRYWLGFIGIQRTVQISLLLMFFGALGIGASPTFTPPLLWLYLSSFIFGMGASGSGVSMNILIAQGTPKKYRRQAYAGLHSTYGIASFAAPFLLNLSISAAFTWSQHFKTISLVPLFFFVVTLFLISRKRLPARTKKALVPPAPFKRRFKFGALFGIYVASEIVISSRLVLFAQKARGLPFETAGKILSAFFFFLMIGRLLFALFPIKGSSEKLLIGSLITTLILFFVGYFVTPWALALTAFSMSYFFPVGMAWMSDIFHEGIDFMTGTVMGALGFSLIFIHMIFGQISNHFGVQWAMLLAPTCLLISLTFLLIVIKENSRQIQ